MSSTNPPNPNVSTFNNLYWSITDIPLTQSQADRRYLKYPVAQGKETLQAVDVNGISTFNAAANFNEPIRMTNIANPKRQIFSSNYSFLSSSDKDLTVGTIYNSSADFYYDNDNNNGTHIFRNKNGAGTQTTPLRINSTSVEMNSPLAMTSATAVNRTIQTTNLNVTNTSNTSVGIISGSAGSIVYDNNVDSGNHQFRTQVGGVEKTVLLLDSNAVTATSPLIMSNTISNNRNVSTSILSIQDLSASANPPITGSITSASTNISYTNNNNSGAHNFIVKDGSGTVQTPITINSNGLIMNTSGDYIQFPDGTQQTTASTPFVPTTYSILYRVTNENASSEIRDITVPANCYTIGLLVWGSGGLSGRVIPTGTGYNGTGGGGSTARSMVTVYPNMILRITWTTNADGNFGETKVQINSPISHTIVTVPNGGDGNPASGSTAGSGADGNTQAPTGNNGFAGAWWRVFNTAGVNGTVSPVVPTLAGAPKGTTYETGGIGVGALQKYSNFINGAVFITYYIV